MPTDDGASANLDQLYRILSMPDEERSNYIAAVRRSYLTDEKIQARNRALCAEGSKQLAECGFPQLKVILNVDKDDEAKGRSTFSASNSIHLRYGLGGMRFYSAHPDLCVQTEPAPCAVPVMPEREARWLAQASARRQESLAELLNLTNRWLAESSLPHLIGAFKLDEDGNPNVAILPRDGFRTLTSPPTFDPAGAGFSPFHIAQFVLGIRFARHVHAEGQG